MMARIIDWCINHDNQLKLMTNYEKWEYREQVLRGMRFYARTIMCSVVCVGLLVACAFLLGGE